MPNADAAGASVVCPIVFRNRVAEFTGIYKQIRHIRERHIPDLDERAGYFNAAEIGDRVVLRELFA